MDILGDYKDSLEQIQRIKDAQTEEKYQAAVVLMGEENYKEAARMFISLGEYKDSRERATEASQEAKILDAYLIE